MEIAGCRVHLAEGGDGRLVLLVRLASRGAGVWDELVPLVAGRHRVASVDLTLPADWTDAGDLLRGFGEQVAAVARELGEERCHVVGWNGGAQIGLQMAVHRPDALATLVLVTPFKEAGEMRQVAVGLDILEMFLRSGRRDLYTWNWFMAGLSDGFVEQHFDVIEALVRERLANDPFVALDVDRAMRWMRDLRRDWVTDTELRQVTAPTLILAAGLNRWHAGPTRAMAEALHAAMPTSRLELYGDRGALFLLENAAPAAARMLDFFAAAG